MEKTPKRSIDSLKEQEVDGQNVKGGFVLTSESNGTGYYTADSPDDKNAALNDAKVKHYKYAVITNRTTGVAKTFTIAY